MELTWENAEIWKEEANSLVEFPEPKWSWDCGFKLDYDGGLLTISSRFYPPHKCANKMWEGTVNIKLFDENIISKDFENNDLDSLKNDVVDFVEEVKTKLQEKLKNFSL